MHDILLSLFAYILIPVSSLLLFLLLSPIGDLLHRQLLSFRTPYSVTRYPYLQQSALLAGLIWSYYAYVLYTMEDTPEELRPVGEHVIVFNKVHKWHLERNFHLSMLLFINLM